MTLDGHISGIPDLQALINGVAQRVSFTLAGASERSAISSIRGERLMLVDARIYEARFPGNRVIFDLSDGRAVEVPIEWFPLLQAAPKDARERYEIEHDGREIAWPELGERVSADAVLLVRFPASTAV